MSYCQELIREANRILGQARAKNITIKLMGGIAFREQCPHHAELFDKMHRTSLDLDFMSLSTENKKIRGLFETLGYSLDKEALLNSLQGGLRRYNFESQDPKVHVDVFFDKLIMCHEIDFRKRLQLEEKTISLSDMLLQKMQIVRSNEKDFADTIILLLDHNVGPVDRGINLEYISKIMADDWGFYYTFTSNLKKVRDLLHRYDVLSIDERDAISQKIDTILKSIEARKKTVKWRVRSMVGTRAMWYEQVEEGVPQ